MRQIDLFSEICEAFESGYGKLPVRHLCNTSGIVNYPGAAFDMVRCGIGLYGYDNRIGCSSDLLPVLSLKSVISQIHELKKGDSVGYNRAYVADAKKTIATLPLDTQTASVGNMEMGSATSAFRTKKRRL